MSGKKFDLRLERLEAEIAAWAARIDELAALLTPPSKPVRVRKSIKRMPSVYFANAPTMLRKYHLVDRALDYIERAKRELADGNPVVAGFHLDTAENIYHMRLVTPVTVTEIVHGAQQNKKTRAGGKEGHETAHGTDAEKQARWDEYQAFTELQDPKLTLTKRRKLAAEHFGVSFKTITRHTK